MVEAAVLMKAGRWFAGNLWRPHTMAPYAVAVSPPSTTMVWPWI